MPILNRLAPMALLFAGWTLTADAAPNFYMDAVKGRWMGLTTTDHISDKPVFFAYLATFDIDGKLGGDLARVILECNAGKASLAVDWTFKAAGARNLVLEYRFDRRPGRSLPARYVNNTREDVTSADAIRHFLADAAMARNLYVRVSSDRYGSSSATFLARAGADMAAKFTAACPAVTPR